MPEMTRYFVEMGPIVGRHGFARPLRRLSIHPSPCLAGKARTWARSQVTTQSFPRVASR